MYDEPVISVRTIDGNINELSIAVDLHQRFALSPCLFSLVMDELISHIHNFIPWWMVYINDLNLVDETNIGVNHMLKL